VLAPVRRAIVVLVLMVLAHAADASAYTDEDYLRFADRVAVSVDGSWSPWSGYYHSTSSELDSRFNAAMLTIHATAAARGWRGPARNDERARRIVRLLTSPPAFFTGLRAPWADRMFHTPGWVGNVAGGYSVMDKAIDPKIAEGLRLAWDARAVLGLSDASAQLIAREIEQVSRTSFFRYPSVRLNQINWPAELYAHEAAVTGTPELLVWDYRAQVRRFVAGVRRPWLRPFRSSAPNLSPSFRFNYQINQPATARRNIDSAEYANITLHFLAFYDEARRAGMPPLPAADMRILRGWVQRALLGYWTHAGFLSWDTGLGYGRWMKTKTWAFAMQGLLAMAEARAFHRDSRYGRWAKTLFDRGVALYERLEEGPEPGIPAAGLFGVDHHRRDVPDGRLLAARMGANAMRAIGAGLGRMTADEPPAYYAFDRDVGRLAVSTPSYATAVVAVNRGAFPYGGNELARLFDRDGDPLSNTGGRVPAAFGIVARDASGRRVLTTQTGLDDARRPPVQLQAVPRPRGNATAGEFRQLTATARRRSGDLAAVTRHTFRPRTIVESWTVRRLRGRRFTVAALFPSWGARAAVEAVLKDGSILRLADEGAPTALSVPLERVQRFRVRSSNGTYLVEPLGPVRGRAAAIPVRAQRSAPRPGPTLHVRLRAGAGEWRLRVRITPL
jgi:hypothetical protein